MKKLNKTQMKSIRGGGGSSSGGGGGSGGKSSGGGGGMGNVKTNSPKKKTPLLIGNSIGQSTLLP